VKKKEEGTLLKEDRKMAKKRAIGEHRNLNRKASPTVKDGKKLQEGKEVQKKGRGADEQGKE